MHKKTAVVALLVIPLGVSLLFLLRLDSEGAAEKVPATHVPHVGEAPEPGAIEEGSRSALPLDCPDFLGTIRCFRLNAGGPPSRVEQVWCLLAPQPPTQTAGGVDPAASPRLAFISNGEWKGPLPRGTWSVVAAHDEVTTYRTSPSALSPASPVCEVMLSPNDSIEFRAMDALTGSSIPAGSVAFLSKADGWDRSLEGDAQPPGQATWLAREGPFPIRAERSAGTYWMGAAGYAWREIPLEESAPNVLAFLTPIGSVEVSIDPGVAGNDLGGVLVRVVPRRERLVLDEGEAGSAWQALDARHSVHVEDVPFGHNEVLVRTSDPCTRGTMDVDVRHPLQEVRITEDVLEESPCSGYGLSVILPASLKRAMCECQLAISAPGGLKLIERSSLMAWEEVVPDQVYKRTWSHLSPGRYVASILPTNSTAAADLMPGQSHEEVLDLSDVRDVAIAIRGCTGGDVQVDWGYVGEALETKQNLAATCEGRARISCEDRPIWLQAYGVGLASPCVTLDPKSLSGAALDLELDAEHAAELELFLSTPSGLAFDPTLFSRMRVEPIGHDGRYVYGRGPSNPSEGYTLVMSARGRYQITFLDSGNGNNDGRARWGREVDIRGSDDTVILQLP